MRWLPSISFSNSSAGSSSSSARSSPARSSVEENQARGSWRFKAARQRKQRNYCEVSPPSRVPKLSKSQHFRCSSGYDRLPAIPQPLPLPEISPESRRKDCSSASSVCDGDKPLPSPKSVNSSASSPVHSIFTIREKRMCGSTDSFERSSEDSRNCHNHSGFANFRLEVPIRSAPTSPFESPVLSPKRPSFDIVPYYLYMASKGNQVWSAPEMPTSDTNLGIPPPFPDWNAFSTDCSPSGSPPGRSIRQFCRSPNNGSSSPFPPRLSSDNASMRWDCSPPLEGHRLPLPPQVSQAAAKPETPIPMKSQWQKGKLIGRGTFGSVYVASNRETGALCAMKEVELFPDDPKSAECIKQLQQEIKVLSQLKHQNIVQYYGSEIIEDRFYIYLEYVHPGSINKYVRDHCGAITESVVRNFTRHILSGLAYLHSTKTIHRDIKGANLLVDSSGVVKLADFGMAKHLTGQVADLSLKGSPYWMAPELLQAVMQKDSNSDLALAVDIWSLGCTIIEMFTGKPPWSDYEGAAAMFKVLKDTPPIPETLSSEGKDFLRCCFKRNPAERPTAAMLLVHRFLKNSQQLDVPAQAFSVMNLTDKAHSPTEKQTVNKLDQYSKSPSKLALDSETGQQPCNDSSKLAMVSLRSPRSILEVRPCLSPPRTAYNKCFPNN